MFTSLRRMTRYAPVRAISQVPIRSVVTTTGPAGKLDENGEPRFLENVQMFL